MLVLFLVKADMIFEKQYYKKNEIRFFCYGNCKIAFPLLTKVVKGYKVFSSINIKKTCLEGTFTKLFLAASLVPIIA